jgi:hypothetical protein
MSFLINGDIFTFLNLPYTDIDLSLYIFYFLSYPVAQEDCPGEEDLNILTDSLSSMRLLKSMQRGDFPLSLHGHAARQLLVQVVKLTNRRGEAGLITRFIKVRAHRGEPLNELADLLAGEAAKSNPARSIALDQDLEEVHFCLMGTWVEWDTRVREDLVQ